MIKAALRNRKSDAELLEREIKNVTAFSTDEHVTIYKLFSEYEMSDFLQSKEIADVVCTDVTLEQGIQKAEQFRLACPKASMILVADLKISPVTYMKPSIMAAALLLKPLQDTTVRQVVSEVFENLIQKTKEDVFVVETREEKYRVPHASILYFESRNKKIYVCTAREEYGFYDTMEHLEEILPDDFIRCHRSYLVNKRLITKIKISKNYLMLLDNIEIPVSRSYKETLKGLEYEQ